MNQPDFDFISGLIKSGSGLVLTMEKVYLLESRLLPVARKHGHDTLELLIAALRKAPKGPLMTDVIEAMTTNESFFFRDVKPFETLRKVFLPEIIKRRQASKTLRIWCAAASTGQEPYSLAMLLLEEAKQLAGWNCKILGTDISLEVLERAKAGTYTHFEVQRGLGIQQLMRFFDKQGELWQVKPEVRKLVEYRHFNLLEDPKSLGEFDVIFCRNVLIYFDQPTKMRVLGGISKIIDRGGILFLGAAETVLGITEAFKPVPGYFGVYAPTPPDSLVKRAS